LTGPNKPDPKQVSFMISTEKKPKWFER
jgi:hypothetical protein